MKAVTNSSSGVSELAEHLVSSGLISDDQLQIGLVQSDRSGQPLEKTIVSLGFVSQSLLNNAILDNDAMSGGRALNVSLKDALPDPDALALVPRELARRFGIVPVSLSGRTLVVATTDLYDLPAQDRLRSLTGEKFTLRFALADEREIVETTDRFYGFELSIDGILHEIETGESLRDPVNPAADYHQPVVRLVDAFLTDAVKNSASDIHFEPEAGFVRIRYRVDGVMRQIRSIHSDYWAAIVVRIKVMAELNIAESRAPQDGQLSMNITGADIEFRVSCMPTVHGENVVLRVLDKQKAIVALDALGLQADIYRQLNQSMQRPEGLILVTGPTGSGKTTTLYSMLNHKSDETINIMTLEDPVEYPMALLRQTSVNEQVKLDFSTGIKSILRQDPDVILVGEIRDSFAAEMVLRASMTGHQVYATLHANSCLGAIERLKDLGVSQALIANNVIAIVGQRLVRKLCPDCRVQDDSSETAQLLNQAGVMHDQPGTEPVVYHSAGCEICNWQGYKGRVAVMEVLRFSSTLNELILSGKVGDQLLECARQEGFTTLSDEAVRLVRSGITSMTEVCRVIDFTNLKV